MGTVVGMWLHHQHHHVANVVNVAHMAPADHTVVVFVVRIANFMGSKVGVDLTVELLAILVVVAVVVVAAAAVVVVVVEMVDDSFEIVLVEDMVHSLATVVWEILVRLQESSALRDKVVVVVVDMAPFKKKLKGSEILKKCSLT